MPKTCTKCGKQLNENDKFCTTCGTPVENESSEPKRFCRQCGNLLAPGAKFCDVCGKEAPQPQKKEEPKIEEPATMDGIVSPVITEDTFAGVSRGTERYDGFESAAMPGAIPEVSAPPPTPIFAMDAAVPSGTAPAPQPAPQPQPQPAPRPQVTPQSIQNSNPYGQFAAKPMNNQPMQNTAMPQQPVQQAQPQNPYSGAPMPGQPIPTYDKQGNPKKESNAVPIILAIIIAVILIADAVIFLGPGKKNKDKEKDVKNFFIVQQLEDN